MITKKICTFIIIICLNVPAAVYSSAHASEHEKKSFLSKVSSRVTQVIRSNAQVKKIENALEELKSKALNTTQTAQTEYLDLKHQITVLKKLRDLSKQLQHSNRYPTFQEVNELLNNLKDLGIYYSKLSSTSQKIFDSNSTDFLNILKRIPFALPSKESLAQKYRHFYMQEIQYGRIDKGLDIDFDHPIKINENFGFFQGQLDNNKSVLVKIKSPDLDIPKIAEASNRLVNKFAEHLAESRFHPVINIIADQIAGLDIDYDAEKNYLQDIQKFEKYAAFLKYSGDAITVPKVYRKLSSQNIMVVDYISAPTIEQEFISTEKHRTADSKIYEKIYFKVVENLVMTTLYFQEINADLLKAKIMNFEALNADLQSDIDLKYSMTSINMINVKGLLQQPLLVGYHLLLGHKEGFIKRILKMGRYENEQEFLTQKQAVSELVEKVFNQNKLEHKNIVSIYFKKDHVNEKDKVMKSFNDIIFALQYEVGFKFDHRYGNLIKDFLPLGNSIYLVLSKIDNKTMLDITLAGFIKGSLLKIPQYILYKIKDVHFKRLKETYLKKPLSQNTRVGVKKLLTPTASSLLCRNLF
ncbi:MAG: AarF/UbiB family protein [Pseudobdellovibrio sp.]